MTELHRSSKWVSFRRRVRPMIAATLPAPCIDPKPGCPGYVQPGDAWDVAHRVAHAIDPMQPLTPSAVGPAHSACNRWNGSKLGAARSRARKRNEHGLPDADSGW